MLPVNHHFLLVNNKWHHLISNCTNIIFFLSLTELMLVPLKTTTTPELAGGVGVAEGVGDADGVVDGEGEEGTGSTIKK